MLCFKAARPAGGSIFNRMAEETIFLYLITKTSQASWIPYWKFFEIKDAWDEFGKRTRRHTGEKYFGKRGKKQLYICMKASMDFDKRLEYIELILIGFIYFEFESDF